MLNFKNVPEQKQFKKGKFIRPGIQNLMLKDITFHVSPNTGNKRPVFSMESEPITEDGWEGHQGALGQIGNVSGNFGYYLKDEAQELEFIGNLKDIMKACGTYDDFMEGPGSKDFTELEDVVNAVKPFVINKIARYFVSAEQYEKLDKTGIGLKLKFPNRFFVEALTAECKFQKFDETNPKHFKKFQKVEVGIGGEPTDLPF